MTGLTICIGYDSKEPLALQVLAHSITTRSSGPVSIVPVAKHHLRESDMPVGEVAELLGFSNGSSFSHWFQSLFGCNASQWRKQPP